MITDTYKAEFLVGVSDDEAENFTKYVDKWRNELDLYKIACDYLKACDFNGYESGWSTTHKIEEELLNDFSNLKIVYEMYDYKREQSTPETRQDRVSFRHRLHLRGVIRGTDKANNKEKQIYRFDIHFQIRWQNSDDLTKMLEFKYPSYVKGLLNADNKL